MAEGPLLDEQQKPPAQPPPSWPPAYPSRQYAALFAGRSFGGVQEDRAARERARFAGDVTMALTEASAQWDKKTLVVENDSFKLCFAHYLNDNSHTQLQ